MSESKNFVNRLAEKKKFLIYAFKKFLFCIDKTRKSGYTIMQINHFPLFKTRGSRSFLRGRSFPDKSSAVFHVFLYEKEMTPV